MIKGEEKTKKTWRLPFQSKFRTFLQCKEIQFHLRMCLPWCHIGYSWLSYRLKHTGWISWWITAQELHVNRSLKWRKTRRLTFSTYQSTISLLQVSIVRPSVTIFQWSPSLKNATLTEFYSPHSGQDYFPYFQLGPFIRFREDSQIDLFPRNVHRTFLWEPPSRKTSIPKNSWKSIFPNRKY